MKCQSCGYALWNLREPRCPECGEGFDVTEWIYQPGSVRCGCVDCDYEFDARTISSLPGTCPACEHVITRNRIRVSPVGDASGIPAEIRKPPKPRPPFALRYAIWVFVIGSVIVVFGVLPNLAWTRGPRPPSIGFLLAALLAGAMVAIGGVDLASRKYRRMNITIWVALFLIYASMPLSLHFFLRHERSKYLWGKQVAQPLVWIRRGMSDYWRDHQELPGSLVMLVADNYVSGASVTARSHSVPGESLFVGANRLQAWYDGKISFEDLQAASDAVKQPSEWEQFGDFLISRRMEFDVINAGQIVVGISPTQGGPSTRCVIYDDGRTNAVDDSKGWVDRQNQLRRSLNLDPIPTDLP